MAVNYYNSSSGIGGYTFDTGMGSANPFLTSPFAAASGSQPAQASTGANGLNSFSASPAAGTGTANSSWTMKSEMPPELSYPQGNLQYLKPGTMATDYPTYMQNLGENSAQQGFQRAQSQMVAGRAPQQMAAAQDALNQSRLGYMAQAGQQAFGVANAQEQAQINLFDLYLKQRQQYVDWMASMRQAAAQETAAANRSGGGGGVSVGGQNVKGGGGSSRQGGSWTGWTGGDFGQGQYTVGSGGGSGTYRALGGW